MCGALWQCINHCPGRVGTQVIATDPAGGGASVTANRRRLSA